MITQEYLKQCLEQAAKDQFENDQDHDETLQKTGFWGKQGAGCIVMARDTGKLLLPLRSRHVEQPNTWGVWGGAIDEDENPHEAAIREFREESHYSGRIDKVVPLYQFKKESFVYHNFLIVIPKSFKPNLNWETAKAKWFDLENLPEPMHFGLKALFSDQISVKKIEAERGLTHLEKQRHKNSQTSWWNSLERHQQENYVARHPNTHFRVNKV